MNTVMVVKDRFTVAGQAVQSSLTGQGAGGTPPFIRRPTRGIQIKEDTFATIRLVCGANGQNINLIDAGSKRTNPNGGPIMVNGMRATDIYSNFLLQQVHEERMEKAQILETFGEPYIFLFGERPRIVTFQGVLVNTFDFNWEAEWWYNYDNYLRGTKAVQNDARVFISYDETLASGYIISASADKISGQPYFLNFQFQMFLTGYQTFSLLGNPYAQPGLSLTATSSGPNSTATQLITSAAAAAVFSPTTIEGTVGAADVDNFNEPTSLADGFENAISTVTQAWTQTSAIVNSVVSGVAGLLIGSQVQVPYGFAGAMEFDDSSATDLLTEPAYGVATKYSTYSDNIDEYVGVGTQYGSAISPSGVFNVNLPFGISDEELVYDQLMVDSATAQWAQYGYNTDPAFTGELSQSILSGSQGLIPTSLSSISASSLDPGTASAPFAAGISAAGLPG